MALTDKLKAIADAIRAKTGKSNKLTLTEMAEEIEGLSIGDTETEDSLVLRTLTKYSNDRITSVGSYAFGGAENLTTVDLPNVTEIGDHAFSDCWELTTVNAPELTKLGDYCFYNTPIAEIDVSKITTVPSNAFDCAGTSDLILDMPNVTYVNQLAFRSFKGAEIRAPAVAGIGIMSFQFMYNVTELSFPNLASAPYSGSAFANCSSLATIDLPKLTTASPSWFEGCYNLKGVNIPLLTIVESNMFSFCTVLSTVNFPVATECNIGAFSNSGLQSVSLPNVTVIKSRCFASCKSLASIVLPKLTQLGDNTAAESGTSGAFASCKALKTADFPVLTYIAPDAFSGCTALTSLVLRGATVCTLQGIKYTFRGTPIASGTGYIYVPDDLVDSYKAATNWSVYAAQIKPLSEYTEAST